MKKSTKILFLSLLITIILFLSPFCYYYAVTYGVKLDEKKLWSEQKTMMIYDNNNTPITTADAIQNKRFVPLNCLQKHTIQAFLCTEDKSFYTHNGLNYKRMLKAILTNVKNKKIKQGASTISQQLIKNTHLSNKKTINRKLKEIKLTKQLESRYTKDEILEMYLNTIYFGHNNYGLASASQFYFSKDPSQLTLNESAVLVGILPSPNNYSPFRNQEVSKQRRNLVLKNMKLCNQISEKEYQDCILQPIDVSQNCTNGYIEGVLLQIEQLNINPYQLKNAKIETFLDIETQNNLECNKRNLMQANIVLSNETRGIIAYQNTNNIILRQPGSTIKPLLVYGPAIEEGLIQNFSLVDDTECDFNGYKPQNYDKKFHGKVTIEESIAKSYNIPAVKTLAKIGISKAEEYAEKLHIKLDEQDKNLALALGGMTQGTRLQELAQAYQTFACQGEYANNSFIKNIKDEQGNILFLHKIKKEKVFEQGTCSLMNQMLKKTISEGTGKKLNNLTIDIACKTGTCGNDKFNTDAYMIAYTNEFTVLTWLGQDRNLVNNLTGGNHCASSTKKIYEQLYKHNVNTPLETTEGTKQIVIDKTEWQQGNILLADPIAPLHERKMVSVLQNQEYAQSNRFSNPLIEKPHMIVNNNSILLYLCQTEYYNYLIKDKNGHVYYDNYWKNEIIIPATLPLTQLEITPYYTYENNQFLGTTITLQINTIQQNNLPQTSPNITSRNWYDQ